MMNDDGKLKREVNLPGSTRNNSNATPIMTRTEVKNYEQDKQEILAYINGVAALLKEHNRQIAPIVDSYKRRTGQ